MPTAPPRIGRPPFRPKTSRITRARYRAIAETVLIQERVRVWRVMLQEMRASTRYAAAGIEGTGLGQSDFRVLEVLLHKGLCPSIR
jgi:hypothetical protein